MKPAHIWLSAVVLPLALCALGALLDGPDDHSAEVDQAKNLESIQSQEEAEAKRAFVAQKVCGNGVPEWLADGALTCTVRNPLRLASNNTEK